jgi:hypothetical protein
MRFHQTFFLCFLLFLLFFGCNNGIEPIPPDLQTGFGGKITFNGQWSDSVARTHLVVFKNPLDSVSDFNAFNLRFVSQEIPFSSTEYVFSSLDSSVIPGTGEFQAGEYSYVAVAQSFTQEVSLDRADWIVAGLYYNEGDTTKPGVLNIPENTFVNDINIVCDFNNLPPQPPGGN